MGEIPIPMLTKAVKKALIFTMQQQPLHMGRIPIPTLIKADREAAGNELNAAIDVGYAQAARLSNHPAIPAIPAIYHTGGVVVLMPRACRAEQSQTVYNSSTIANTSDDIDYSIGRSMNRL
eukprot:scaffold4764_cov88-Skeletonema_dohrnii-CCMP3373.AAC.1